MKKYFVLFFFQGIFILSSMAQKVCDVSPGSPDADVKIQNCIFSTPDGGTVLLRPGTYKLNKRLQVFKPITISTLGFSTDNDYVCKTLDKTCAVLSASSAFDDSPGLLHIQSSNVVVDHIAFDGNRREKKGCSATVWQKGIQIAIEGDRVTVHGSSFYDGRCGTAIEVRVIQGRPPEGINITYNRIVENGRHDRGWSDGLTVHAAKSSIFNNNILVDNTDVQMIFGACIDCEIGSNSFRHSDDPIGGSYADLVLFRWKTHPFDFAGDYSGTVVHDNVIKCGPKYNCGFGILAGGNPWSSQPGRIRGANIRNNDIRNAQHALVVTKGTRNIELRDNSVSVDWSSSEKFLTLCGEYYNGTRYSVSPASINITARPLTTGERPLFTTKWDSPCVPNAFNK